MAYMVSSMIVEGFVEECGRAMSLSAGCGDELMGFIVCIFPWFYRLYTSLIAMTPRTKT